MRISSRVSTGNEGAAGARNSQLHDGPPAARRHRVGSGRLALPHGYGAPASGSAGRLHPPDPLPGRLALLRAGLRGQAAGAAQGSGWTHFL